MRYECIHRLFEEQVSKRPNQVAVAHRNLEMTYCELNAAADRIATFLRGRGARPGAVIAICMDRSLELVAAMLGVLKAGCAYLPINTEFPRSSVDHMVIDSRVRIVICHARHAALFDGLEVSKFEYESNIARAALQSEIALTDTLSSVEDLAYITYTSGSSGRPKGTLIPHRSVMGFMTDVTYATYDESQVFLHYSSISWDAPTLEIWTPLLKGGRCVLFPDEKFSLDRLEGVIAEYGITILWLTGSVFNAVIDSRPQMLAPLKQLLIGGEKLSARHVHKAKTLLKTRIIACYGPSECTVFACSYPVPDDFDPSRGIVPLGGAIGDREVSILDNSLKPVADGQEGELCIAGKSVALGYINGDVTGANAAFVRNPFNPAEPMYKTGDLVRRNDEGLIEFIARKDKQVKIRGYRIELGEIENFLNGLEGVQQAIVVARNDLAGNPYLCAYLMMAEPLASETAIRARLSEGLPEFMHPRFIVFVATIPFTANGKANTAALPDPLSTRQPAPQNGEGSDEIESTVLGLFKETLGLLHARTDDGFEQLGGDSLKLFGLTARINARFEIDLSVKDIARASTAREVARRVAGALRGTEPSPVVGV